MANYIQWDDSFLIGNTIIDFDHQTLVTITNNLFRVTEEGESPAELEKTFSFLVDYVEKHFAREEKIFLASDYPDAEEHIRKHREITKTVHDLAATFRNDPDAINIDEVMTFLRKWLKNHILKTDRGYREYI
jgi:hemerythrin